MPSIANQSQFRKWEKPNFCYLCGGMLADGTDLNFDHLPPESMFAISDRANYPIKLKVHARCNHRWHSEDEKMAIFYDVLHGNKKASNPSLQKKLKIVTVENDQGIYQGITEFPIRLLAYRIMRGAHALIYREFLPEGTKNHIHYPLPEVDRSNGNNPISHEMQTYSFANELCKAQKTNTHDYLSAYNQKFKYVCTWSHLDNGQPICIFAFDIYRFAHFAVRIHDFPRAFIGFYAAPTPVFASKCSQLSVDSSDEEILYPILER